MMITNFANSINMNNYELRESTNSLLVVAKKKIILPESKIIIDNLKPVSSYEYPTGFDNEYEKAANGFLLAR